MKLKFAVRDVQYMRAIADAISKTDRNFNIEIGRDLSTSEDQLLITDLSPEEYTAAAKRRSIGNVLFLTSRSDLAEGPIVDRDPCFIYKYSRVSELTADLRLKSFDVFGTESILRNPARVCSVATDGNCCIASRFSVYMARQYIYRVGGEALVIPFAYADYASDRHEDRNDAFIKMMYYISTGRELQADAFLQRDPSGVSFIRTGKGLNPIALLDPAEAGMLVDYFSDSTFDFVILDIGNNLCEGNRKLAAGSEYRYWLTDRDETASDLVAEAVYGDLSHHKVNVRSGIDKLPIIADNQIRRLFNIDDERNSDQVRGRDR